MIDSIKITSLADIGGNITYSTLVPVVDMNGTPTTKKANLQILGNLILNGAGGSYFPAAAQSILALSVANAAQPNITSVGTLTGLTVSGNISAGNANLGNIVVANYFSGDGSLLTNVGTSYSNADVANYLPTYNGNVGANWIIADHVSGNANPLFHIPQGNLVGVDGNSSNVLYGNGVFAAVTAGNAIFPLAKGTSNIDIADVNGNVTITANGVNTWTFSDAGTFISPGNVYLEGDVITVGPGADTLAANLANPTLVISSNSNAYIQAAINNVSDIGSADWIAYGHHGNDAGGWADLGFTSASFSDANYTITGAGDGYVFVQGYLPGQAPFIGGGNLVIATGEEGLTKDIVFATGGFLSSNEFARIDHANSSLHLTRAGSSIKYADGSVQNTAFTTAQANILANAVNWTTVPTANTDPGIAGQAAYDAGGNLFVCVSTNTWAKFAGTISW